MVPTDAALGGVLALMRVWLDHVRGDKCRMVVQRMATGDRMAFGDFYDLTAAKVLGIVSTSVTDQRVAEEVTAEIFLEFWRSAPTAGATFEPLRSVVLFTVLWMQERRGVLTPGLSA